MSILRSAFVMAVVGVALGFSASVRADELAGSVAAKLRESGALAGYRVNVKAKSGTVWLEGRVADQKQMAAAMSLAENTPGVERVVNRLSIGAAADTGAESKSKSFEIPASVRAAAAKTAGIQAAVEAGGGGRPPEAAKPAQRGMFGIGAIESPVQLVQALTPAGKPQSAGGRHPVNNAPRPLAMSPARPVHQPSARPADPRAAMRGPLQRTSMRSGVVGDPMHLPAPSALDGAVPGGVADGQMVPGSMRIVEGGPTGGEYVGGGVPGGAEFGGAPMPMGGTGVGMPPIPGRADGPNMPNYAWPSYAAYGNVAAVQYPTQYSPTAWPYIGPFYPYPQVPLGWRRVSLEWDDGWWWLDFDERHIHSHHR